MAQRSRKNSQYVNKERRTFLKMVGVAALWEAFKGGLLYDAERAVAESVSVHARIIKDLDTDGLAVEAAEHWPLINSVFGPFQRVVLSPAYANPQLAGRRHDNDWRAAIPFAAAMKGDVGKALVLNPDQEEAVKAHLADWDKVLLGGAVSHPLARTAQGYVAQGEDLQWSGKSRQNWFICYDRNRLTRKNLVTVYHSSLAQYMQEPIWEIHDSSGRPCFTPKTIIDDRGRRILISNWLLITKIVEKGGRPLVMAAGCHGVGTASFGLLTADEERLGQLKSAVGQNQQWQAVYEIKRVHYRDDDRRFFCTREDMNLEDVSVLPANPIHLDWMAS